MLSLALGTNQHAHQTSPCLTPRIQTVITINCVILENTLELVPGGLGVRMTRAERVDRYREKKARRCDGATVRYVARQLNAHRCHAVVTQSNQRPQTPILPVHSRGVSLPPNA